VGVAKVLCAGARVAFIRIPYSPDIFCVAQPVFRKQRGRLACISTLAQSSMLLQIYSQR